MSAPVFIEVEGKRYRSVSLDEWIMQLQAGHPARAELATLRSTAASALEAVDKLERENSELQRQLIKVQLQQTNAARAGQETHPQTRPLPAGQ